MTTWMSALGTAYRTGVAGQTGWTWDERRAAYAVADAYYNNTAYARTSAGGYRDAINAALGNAGATDIDGLYNPVAAVVDLYLHIFDGAFGDEITIEPAGNDGEPLRAAVADIWRWSNMTVEKRRLCRLPALHGMCGIRIVGRDTPGMERVYLKAEHPNTIRDMQLDDRGNVERVQLEYPITAGLGERADEITIREELDKERIRTWRVQGSLVQPFDLQGFLAAGSPLDTIEQFDGGPRADYPNPLGVTPYVIAYFDDGDDKWGRSAWAHARTPVDRLNALVSHLDIQIHEHVRSAWLVAASGQPPQEFDLSGRKIVYVQLGPGNAPPSVDALVTNLDIQQATNQARFQLEKIEDMLPELKATAGRFLANQSGETVAELRKPAEDRLSLARDSIEDALVRAQQIAVSWGVMLGIWDVGTGKGTRDAAERAYREGYEDHKFNKRPLLNPPAPAAQMPARDEAVQEEDDVSEPNAPPSRG